MTFHAAGQQQLAAVQLDRVIADTIDVPLQNPLLQCFFGEIKQAVSDESLE